ncbi:helix-turn-helix transcriptional regulator [Streptomyces sp. SudanB182_2057]|uniref:helix-turn-helix transcriptional regulator n=1 Tax=Streptomyces sp. SudanB182_2057 TaxID=3035281 RepID=UPI003F5467AD
MAAEAVAAAEKRGAPARPRRVPGLPAAFAGLSASGRPHLRVSAPSGPPTAPPRPLAAVSGPAPYGRTGAPARPYAVPDRARSRRISHAYDAPAAAERIHAVLAVPVVTRRRVRGVLHGGVLHTSVPGSSGRTWAASSALSSRTGTRRPARQAQGAGPGPRAEPLAGGGPPATPPRAGGVTLAPREPDVLSWETAGATGAAVAERPGTGPESVERHPRPAMRRPGARTRGEAVSAARGARGLPRPEDSWETCPFIRRRFEFPPA